MGILTMLFNWQILHYMGTDELAVYGVIVMVSTFVQCCGYGIGQGAQPILSQNYGAETRARKCRDSRRFGEIAKFLRIFRDSPLRGARRMWYTMHLFARNGGRAL